MRARVLELLTVVVWAAVAGCVLGALAGWGVARAVHLPQADQLGSVELAAATRVLARDGTELANFAVERRIVLPPEAIPDHLKQAIVAVEDADFYRHGGVDPVAIVRAVFHSIKERRLGARGGASTLTQQLARNLFRMHERTLRRKIKEALLAIDIEKRYSKDQILTMYANLVFLGHGAYGVEAASRLYFGKPARELTLPEAALLAGMIQNPNRMWSPIRNPSGALKRRNHVLRRMLELGYIDREAYEAAVRAPLGASLHTSRHRLGGHFVEAVRQALEQRYGTEGLYQRGLTVRTTLDPALQRAAERAVREGLVALDMSLGWRDPRNVIREGLAREPGAYEPPSWKRLELEPGGMVRAVVLSVRRERAVLAVGDRRAVLHPEGAAWTRTRSLGRLLEPGDLVLVRLPDPLPQDPGAELPVELLQEPELEAALVAMDNRTGEVLALVGGFDFGRSQFNRATQARRQCGSAFKPFVYLTAFEQGFTPADTLFDAPVLLPDAEGRLTYCPKNYYGRYYGITTLRRALELSFNATAVKLQQLVGGSGVIGTARAFGISTPLAPYASMALGSFEVRLIDLVRAYAGFANLGEVPEPLTVQEVRDRDGRTLERAFPAARRAAPPAPTYLLIHVLEGVVERGTGRAARELPAHLAGKTGTTDDYTDAWFVGFTPRLTVGVWVGRDLKRPIGERMTGARAALPIWIRFVRAYLEGLDEDTRAEPFPVPAGVVFAAVDPRTGRRATPSCDAVVLEAFLDGTEPQDECDPEAEELVSLPWPMQLPAYTPRPGEPMPTAEAVAVADGRLEGREAAEVLEELSSREPAPPR